MAYIPNQFVNTGSYVSTTNVWDVGALQSADINSAEFKELLVRLYQNVNNISLVLNTKDSAFYLTQEFVTGQLYFNPLSFNQLDLRGGFRIVINIGPLAPGTVNIAHGLVPDSNWTFTFINGAASDTVNMLYYPIPYSSSTGNTIEVTVDATYVNVTNNTAVTFTNSYVILEYLKS